MKVDRQRIPGGGALGQRGNDEGAEAVELDHMMMRKLQEARRVCESRIEKDDGEIERMLVKKLFALTFVTVL